MSVVQRIDRFQQGRLKNITRQEKKSLDLMLLYLQEKFLHRLSMSPFALFHKNAVKEVVYHLQVAI